MNIRIKNLLGLALACFTTCAIAIFISAHKISEQGETDLIDKSQAILSRLEEARNFVASQGGLKDKIKVVVAAYPDGNFPKEVKEEILKQVPIYASILVGNMNSAEDHYKFRVFSDEPRRKENLADEHEMQIFKNFAANPNLPEIVEKDTEKVTVFRPIRLAESQGCLVCHGDPATSPFKNGKDIVGFNMENWKDGKLHGVFAIVTNKDEVKAAAAGAIWSVVGFGLIGTILAMFLGSWIVRGDFKTLRQMANDLGTAGEQINAASAEVSGFSSSLSAATAESAASLEETTASTVEMSAMIKLNSQNAAQAKDLSHSCEQSARHGKEEVDRLIIAIQDISQSSKKIEEIINVIDDIAFQTNLLALNAAVEAARAGEQGRGFAVVAEAVRSLAQKSASSAKEINDLIKASVDMIHQGSKIAEESGAALTEIVGSVEKVAQLNIEISNASNEQTQGVENITKAISELDKVTQQNAAGSQETAAASNELSAQASQMHGLVESLLGILEGKDKAMKSSSSPIHRKNKVSQALPLSSDEKKSADMFANRKPGKISKVSDFNKAS